MYQNVRPLIGTRHYQYPKIEYRIPPVKDFLEHWGGRTPCFNLLPDAPLFLIEKVGLSWQRHLRRRAVPRVYLTVRQQTVLIAGLTGLGMIWRYSPVGFFMMMALLGVFQVAYRQLMVVPRRDPAYPQYRLVAFYSRLAFWGMVVASFAYLRLAF